MNKIATGKQNKCPIYIFLHLKLVNIMSITAYY